MHVDQSQIRILSLELRDAEADTTLYLYKLLNLVLYGHQAISNYIEELSCVVGFWRGGGLRGWQGSHVIQSVFKFTM